MPSITTDQNTSLNDLAQAFQNSDARDLRASGNTLSAKTGVTNTAGKFFDRLTRNRHDSNEQATAMLVYAYQQSSGGQPPSQAMMDRMAATVRGKDGTVADLISAMRKEALADRLTAHIDSAGTSNKPEDVLAAAKDVINSYAESTDNGFVAKGREVLDAINNNPHLTPGQKRDMKLELAREAVLMSGQHNGTANTLLRENGPHTDFLKAYMKELSDELTTAIANEINNDPEIQALAAAGNVQGVQNAVAEKVADIVGNPTNLSPDLKQALQVVANATDQVAQAKPALNASPAAGVNGAWVLGAINPQLVDKINFGATPQQQLMAGAAAQAFGVYHNNASSPNGQPAPGQDPAKFNDYRAAAAQISTPQTPSQQLVERATRMLTTSRAESTGTEVLNMLRSEGQRMIDSGDMTQDELDAVMLEVTEEASRLMAVGSLNGGEIGRSNGPSSKFLSELGKELLQEQVAAIEQEAAQGINNSNAAALVGDPPEPFDLEQQVEQGLRSGKTQQQGQNATAGYRRIGDATVNAVLNQQANPTPRQQAFMAAIHRGGVAAAQQKPALRKDGADDLTPSEVGDRLVQNVAMLRVVGPALNNNSLLKSENPQVKATGVLLSKGAAIFLSYDNSSLSGATTGTKPQDHIVDAMYQGAPNRLNTYRDTVKNLKGPQAPGVAVNVAPAVVNPAPAVVNPAPAVVNPAPAVVNPAPAVVNPAPAVVNPAPAVVNPAPAVVNQPPAIQPDPEGKLTNASKAGVSKKGGKVAELAQQHQAKINELSPPTVTKSKRNADASKIAPTDQRAPAPKNNNNNNTVGNRQG